jgi:hypothetical protein
VNSIFMNKKSHKPCVDDVHNCCRRTKFEDVLHHNEIATKGSKAVTKS